ncbi:recombinase family protein [bacterium]|nr:recombinase family protein [bacterium]
MLPANIGTPSLHGQAIGTSERVGIYARVSTYGQLKNTSLHEQQRKLQDLARGKDYQVFDTYVDGGESGTTLERPEVTRMLADAQEGRFHRVLMLDYDRMTRSDLVDATIRSVFRSLSIKIETPNDEYDLEDPDDNFEVALFGALAQREWMKIRKRMVDGRMAVQAAGGFTGGAIPFGWRRNPGTGKIEIDPDEESAIRRLWELAASGLYGYRKMADIMASEGHVFRRKQLEQVDDYNRALVYEVKPFDSKNVRNILRNPRYAGLEVARRDYTRRGHGNKRGSVTVESREFPAIVTPEVFERVQHSVQQRKTYGEKWDRIDRNPLSGIVRCPVCATPMMAKYGYGNLYYGCYVRSCAKGMLYRMDLAHEAVLRLMRQLVPQLVAEEELALDESNLELGQLNDRLAELMGKADRLAEALLIDERDGGLSPLIYAKLNKQIQEDISATKQQIGALCRRELVYPRLREALLSLDADDPDLGEYCRSVFKDVWFKVDRVERNTKYLSVAKATLVTEATWGTDEATIPKPMKRPTIAARPTKEELAALLVEESYSAIGRRFDVADTTVKKWARKHGLVE